jgi:phosphate/phosphite/phosphonate ABC transporter binding protein
MKRRSINVGFFLLLLVLFSVAIMVTCHGAKLNGARKKTYIFSTIAWTSEKEMKRIYRPLMDYLEEQTGIHFQIDIPETYEIFISEVEDGNVQFASLNAVGYLKVLKGNNKGIRYLATSTRSFDGGPAKDYYEGYIIVLKDSRYNSLEDLRGKRFGFVSEDSSSGYKIPVAMMAARGINYKTFFKKYFFFGDHDEVIKAVKNRSVEGGATWDNGYTMNVKKYGDIFNVIYRTPPIPSDAWCTGPGVPAETGERMKIVLLGIDENTRTADGRIVLNKELGFPADGWSERNNKFYEDIGGLLMK